ncbi:PAS domain S-box [Thermoplasmatales archaeon SCGC AB-540-F20]|nr:PAS domain S-box [Thermoplasmatales archaeon SCGC AB-540-F20]
MRTEDYSKIGKRNTLVFTLNKNGEIVEFDKGCQKITGYSRDEALTRKILDFLIPENYIKQWGEMFDLVLKNGNVDNFKIPWKTCEGKEILISWSCFFIEDNKGFVKDICFIGKDYGMNYHEKDSLETSKNYLNSKMKV